MFYHFRWLSGPMKQQAWICLSFVPCRLAREFNSSGTSLAQTFLVQACAASSLELSLKLSCWYILEEKYFWSHWTGHSWDTDGLCNSPVCEGCSAREIPSQPLLPICRYRGRRQWARIATEHTNNFALLPLDTSMRSLCSFYCACMSPFASSTHTLVSAHFQIITELASVRVAWISAG